MAAEYQIFLVNESVRPQVFSCFLQPPAELLGDVEVYANSGVSLLVEPNSPSMDAFTLYDQYLLGAGSSRAAVEPRAILRSTIELPASLRNRFLATFAEIPPPQNPLLDLLGNGAGSQRIRVRTNAYDQEENHAHGWFEHLSFGISTHQGFSGVTWSPTPRERWTFTPSPAVHLVAGDLLPNQLIPWQEIAGNSGVVSIPDSFSLRKATATYSSRGLWEISPGAPRSGQDIL
ncbi:MAG: hypothetical protein AAGD01_17330 [Acidobacteriota bacterium]